jgi:hypothetical protein
LTASVLPAATARVVLELVRHPVNATAAEVQGLTLVHLSAQRKHFLWARGCIQGLFRGCIAGFNGY